MRSSRVRWGALAALLLTGLLLAAGAPAAPRKPVPHGRCARAGTKAKVGARTFICRRRGKALVWLQVGGKTKGGQPKQGGQPGGSTGGGGGTSSGTAPYAPGGTCSNRTVDFTSPPMPLAQIGYIAPLGRTHTAHVLPTDHVYLVSSDQQAPDNTYPILMPADGSVVEIQQLSGVGEQAGQTPPVDHFLAISYSCRFYTIFIHVHKLSGALAPAAAGMKDNESRLTNIPLKAGAVLGYVATGADWINVDNNVTLPSISPCLYTAEPWKIHSVSPFDLYKGALKAQLEAKSLRTAAPVGGKIAYDQPGKLIGNWFRQGSGGDGGNHPGNGYWDGFLAVVPDYLDPATTVLSIGNWAGAVSPGDFQGKAAQFVVRGSPDPAAIGVSTGMVKWELTELEYVTGAGAPWELSGFATGIHPSTAGAFTGTILLQVLPGEQLKLEEFPGQSAADVTGFTPAAQTYVR